jgi:hypothetical protein
VERGVRSVLEGRCEVKQFDMDTKRYKTTTEIEQKAHEAKILIDTWQPDVVIAADDNAAKYVIMAFYKDHRIPFVFCGINWTVEEYGFPYRNATGMIEVAPGGACLPGQLALCQRCLKSGTVRGICPGITRGLSVSGSYCIFDPHAPGRPDNFCAGHA